MRKLLILTTVLLATPALAHAPKIGPHGGAQADAGDYHVEIVAKDTTLEVYVRDHSDNPVPAAGFKGTAILVVDGKPQRIPLTPAAENRLTGTSPVVLPAAPKGAVQITPPKGATAQAKFN
jgi:hypothetical protein